VRAGRFPENVSYAKVYRTAADGADFYCIGEITESGGQLTDKTPDGTAQMLNPLESENSYPPPDGGRFLTEYGGVFFLGVGERLYFSERENPHGWPRLNFIGMGDRITGIAKETQGLLVFTRNNCYHITGTDSAETITKYEVPGNQGCPDFRSIASLNNTPVWVSNDGLCMWTGSRIAVISNRRIRKEDFTVRYAATANDCYYLFTADGCLVYDLRNGSYDNDIEARIGIFYKLSETAKYAWYDGDGDMLFLYDGKTVRLSGGGERGEWRYASPYIGGTECAMHRFHEMEIAHTGKIELTVFCDGKPVFSRVLSGDGRKKRVKFPWTAGQRVNIEMTGNGELNEYAVFFE